jgi:hypothetical protein
LKIGPDAISLVSEKEKHSFHFKHSQYSYALNDDQLTIKAGSKVYNFKSAVASTKAENRTRLLEIYHRLSALHPVQSSTKT